MIVSSAVCQSVLDRSCIEVLCKEVAVSYCLSRAVETVYPMISTRGPRCVATGISQCLRQQWSHVNPVHSSSVPPSGQPFRYTPSWRTGYFSLLGAHPFLRHQNQDSMTPQLLTTSQLHTNVATAATHTSHRTLPSYPSVHPFLLLPVAASRIACNPRHHYHSMAAITCTRRYTSDSKLPPQQPHRSGYYSHWRPANRSTLTYMVAIAVAVVGLAYAAVPLYRLFCQASGYGGTVIRTDPGEKVEKMQPIRERELTIRCDCFPKLEHFDSCLARC